MFGVGTPLFYEFSMVVTVDDRKHFYALRRILHRPPDPA